MSTTGSIRLRDPGGAEALIDPRCGGAVRRLRLCSATEPRPVEVLWGQTESESDPCHTTWFDGRMLMPFADRIPAGRYRWDGREYCLPINDSQHGDAIHGFLYRQSMSRGDEQTVPSGRSLHLSTVLPPRDGYPWSLRVELSYTLMFDRFSLRFRTWNLSTSPAPFCAGWHPYFLVPGAPDSTIDSAVLQVVADSYLEADADLRLSGATPPVAGSPYDFRVARPIGATELDIALTLSNSEHTAIVLRGRQRAIAIHMGGAWSKTQLFIPPGRAAIAIEPISAPGEAFTTPSLGLITIQPGAMVTGWARVTLR